MTWCNDLIRLYEHVLYELCVNVVYILKVVVFLLWFDMNIVE